MGRPHRAIFMRFCSKTLPAERRKGGTKACKEKRCLYLLREGEILPIIMTLPTGSLSEFTKLMKGLVEAIIVWPERMEIRFKCGVTVEQEYVK